MERRRMEERTRDESLNRLIAKGWVGFALIKQSKAKRAGD
jgi:hypothetical protein